MRRLRRRLTAVIGQSATDPPNPVKPTLPERFPYHRPWFLMLDSGHTEVSSDHHSRYIISARDCDSLPCRAGYAEVINAGKTTLNEDQAHACVMVVGQNKSHRLNPNCCHSQDISDNFVIINDGDENGDENDSRIKNGRRTCNVDQFQSDEAYLPPSCQCKVDTKKYSIEFGPFLHQKHFHSHDGRGVDAAYFDQCAGRVVVDSGTWGDVLQDCDSEDNLKEKERWRMTYFAIFDGHAGSGAALMAVNLLHHIIERNLCGVREELMRRQTTSEKCQQKPSRQREPALDLPAPYIDKSASIDVDNLVIGALETAFQEMDTVIEQERMVYQIHGGCTALVAVVFNGRLYVANAGDSRAVISVKDRVIPMSEDFTPLHERERLQTLAHVKPELLHNEFCHLEFPKRVTQTDIGRSMFYRDAAMTGWGLKTIAEEDTKFPLIYGEGKRVRLMATIGVTRGFGDHDLKVYDTCIRIKPFLTSLPQVKVYDLSAETHGPNDVLIMGTDGLWDVVTNSQAWETVLQSLQQLDDSDKFRYTSAAYELVLNARGIRQDDIWRLTDGSQASNDDITAFVIPLQACVQLSSE